jgi:preprotein translocase subunit SecG
MDRLEVRVSITKVLLCLIVVIVPLSVVGLILTQNSDKALDNSIGNNFRTMAQIYSNEVSEFMLDRVHDVMAMSADPVIIQAVSNANRSGSYQQQPAKQQRGSSAAAPARPGPSFPPHRCYR